MRGPSQRLACLARLVACTVTLVAAAGCCHREATVGAPARLPISASVFDYARAPVEGTLEPAPAESERFRTEVLTFPADDRDDPKNPVVRALLRTPLEDPRGLVVVYPVLGGDYSPSDAFATDLAGRGWRTLRFDRKVDVFDSEGDFRTVARRLRQSVIDVRRGIDWATDEGIAPRHGIGLVGISLGSIIGSLAAASDPRIHATVLLLGGGDLVEILEAAASEEEVAALLAALAADGLDDATIEARARRAFAPIEPLDHVARLDPESTLLVHARFDAVVPYANGTRLWEAAGEPARLTIPTGHYGAVLYLPYLLSAVADHLDEHLAP